MLNVFDKVWYEGLISKLKQNDISGNLLNLLYDLMRNKKTTSFIKWATL